MTLTEALAWANNATPQSYADSHAPRILAAELRRLRLTLAYIAENGGKPVWSPNGAVHCDGAWCANQARTALEEKA